MHYLLIIICSLPVVMASCVFPSEEEAKPKGLEERALDSEVVLAAYTRTVHRSRNTTTSYSAEFLVFNVIKGDDQVAKLYQKRKPSSLETALNRRLVNVSNFGDPSKCESDVSPGETYILLLDVMESGELSARYDGAYGPAVVFSRDKETALEAIGSSPWGEWSPCSGSCGGGIQQRRRQCDGSGKCSDDDGQQRTCNMFSCAGILNILEVAGVHRSSLRSSGRPSAYKLLPSGTWRSGKEEVIFPRTFPWEFSLLVTVRVKPSSTGGFILRVLHSDSLQVGLYISDILTLVLSDKKNIRVSFVKSLFDDRWHQIAFSVRRDTVSFYLNCEYSGKLPLPGKIRPFGGQPATVIVGSTGDHELDAFQGDVEQLTISGSPDAAENQCNSTTTSLNYRGGHYAMRQEVRSRPVLTSATQNDQLPLRGDIIDDEDFSFEPGSGDQGTQSEEDYDDDQDVKKSDNATSSREAKIPLKAESTDSEDEDEEEDEEDDYDDTSESDEEDKEEVKKDDVDTDDDDEKEDGDDEDEKEHDDDKDEEDRDTAKEKDKDYSKIDDDDEVDRDYEKDDTATKDDDKDIEEIEDEDPHQSTYDYTHPDEEKDKDEDDFEGSGEGSKIELAWSEWSPCSSTCNWGRRTRTSYCLDNGLNLERCAEASSKRSETEACFVKLCPTTTTTMTTITTTSSTTPLPINYTTTAVLRKSECRVRCQNGGTCNPPYRCVCPPSVYGSLCQYAKQTCRVNCKNGGTCFPPATCSCQKGYFGSECQYALCKPQCLNGGACVAPNKCRCKAGYVGNSCHKAICQHGCKNGGECVAPNKCACRSGFSGKDCSQPYCNPVCQNGGECVKPYFCHCPAGTKGTFCEKFLCKPECQNGGICVGKGKCSCPRGYAGYNCEQAYCPGGCLNGGKCGKTGKCVCQTGFSGTHCETKKPCKFVEVKEPYKRGYKQKVMTQAQVPCGAWGWKMCTKTKVHYEMVYKTFYKTFYECEGLQKNYPEYQKMKNG